MQYIDFLIFNNLYMFIGQCIIFNRKSGLHTPNKEMQEFTFSVDQYIHFCCDMNLSDIVAPIDEVPEV